MKVRNFEVKRILMIGAMLAMFCLVYAYNFGDYQAVTSFANIDSPFGWMYWDGVDWAPAGQSLAELSPYSGTIYTDYSFNVNADFTLDGRIIQTAGTVMVTNNSTFTISENGIHDVVGLRIDPGSRVVNNGQIRSVGSYSNITLYYADNMETAPELINNGFIVVRGELNIDSYGRIVSNPGARITGTGVIRTGNEGAEFVIGNAGGYNEAFGGVRTHDVYNASFVFNGTTNQVTGNKLPGPIHSLTIDNGNTVTLSGNITMTADPDPVIGNPTVTVKSGSTLDVRNYVIASESSEPGAVAGFVLEAGATIATANVDGISSQTNGTNIIQSGSIQTNQAFYDSGANYVFNGTQRQFSGCFVTSPLPNTVHNITNMSGIDLCPDFKPLHYTGEAIGEFNTDPTIYWGYIDPETVPVIMSYFNAVFNAVDGVVNLKWETHSEHNNLGFYIYRATEREFVRAELISPLIESENSTEGSTYTYTDSELFEDGTYYYWLQAASHSSMLDVYGPATVQVTFYEEPNIPPDVPLVTSLVRNYPNPFNPSTQLEYFLETGADVKFTVFNLKGQIVDQFTLTNKPAGLHRYNWEPQQLSSGTYIVKFSAAGKSNTRKVILAK